MTEVDTFDYELPRDLVAATPADRRDASRMLVLDRAGESLYHATFGDLTRFLRGGDLVVLNDARVMPARLHAHRETGGEVETLLVRRAPNSKGVPPWPSGDDMKTPPREPWLAMLGASGTLREGEILEMKDADARIELLQDRGRGYWHIRFRGAPPMGKLLRDGSVPLPPYIQKARKDRGMRERMPEVDPQRYQTVFASRPGAVAAPTAGLHFTDEVFEEAREGGVRFATLTLLVGPGTFRPVRTEHVEDHELEPEYYHLPGETAEQVRQALEDGRRVIATGTTCCRVLEYVARREDWEEHSGWTDLFIHPPFDFRVLSGLITNFHLPRSTLLMLVSAFAGRERVLKAYREAVRREYRFYSYGDAMFIC